MLSRIGLAAALIGLTYFSLIPSDSVTISASDKIMHFIAYGMVAGALAAALPRTSLLWVFIASSAIGIALEAAQAVLPTGRSASVGDQIANMGGAALAIFIWLLWVRLKPQKPQQN